MSKAKQTDRKKRRKAATRQTAARAGAEVLRGPLGRALADEFYATYPGIKEQYAGREEILYEGFARLVEAKFIRLTGLGDNIRIELDPKVAAAIRAGGPDPFGAPATAGNPV